MAEPVTAQEVNVELQQRQAVLEKIVKAGPDRAGGVSLLCLCLYLLLLEPWGQRGGRAGSCEPRSWKAGSALPAAGLESRKRRAPYSHPAFFLQLRDHQVRVMRGDEGPAISASAAAATRPCAGACTRAPQPTCHMRRSIQSSPCNIYRARCRYTAW
jgi:hypothetical protein